MHVRTGPTAWHLRPPKKLGLTRPAAAAHPQNPSLAHSDTQSRDASQHQRPRLRVWSRSATSRCAAKAWQGFATGATAPSLDPDRLLALLQRMHEDDQVPEPEWCDMLYGVTSASVAQLTPQQRTGLFTSLVQLGVEPPADWALLMLQTDLTAVSGVQVLEAWTACQAVGVEPGRSWLLAAMQQLGAQVRELSGLQAAMAVALAAGHLPPLTAAPLDTALSPAQHPPPSDSGSASSGSEQPTAPGSHVVKQTQADTAAVASVVAPGDSEWLGQWLDAMTLRIVECVEDAEQDTNSPTGNSTAPAPAAEGVPVEAVLAVCSALTYAFRHTAPEPWLEFVSSRVSLLPGLGAEDSALVAVTLAAAGSLPDLVFPPQMYMQTATLLSSLTPPLLCDVVWAVASWQVGKEGTAIHRFDLRPPEQWWSEWFQATGAVLRDDAASKEVLVRVLWSLAVLRVRPPQPWTLLLVNQLNKLLMARAFTPLELLYVSRSADMWYGMLLGVDAAQAGAVTAVLAGTAGQAAVPSRLMKVVGVEEGYPPPAQLAALVRDSVYLLTGAALPPGWRRINPRYPPYALPVRDQDSAETLGRQGADEEELGGMPGAQEQTQGDVAAAGAVRATIAEGWQQSEAARRIYGPLTPPAWR